MTVHFLDALPADERELVTAYRALATEGRVALLKLARAMANEQGSQE